MVSSGAPGAAEVGVSWPRIWPRRLRYLASAPATMQTSARPSEMACPAPPKVVVCRTPISATTEWAEGAPIRSATARPRVLVVPEPARCRDPTGLFEDLGAARVLAGGQNRVPPSVPGPLLRPPDLPCAAGRRRRRPGRGFEGPWLSRETAHAGPGAGRLPAPPQTVHVRYP